MRIAGDVKKKIRSVEIYTRRLLSGSLVGSSRSAVKGLGFEFDQIREYEVGVDVRSIDWNASARMNTLLIKQYIEERSRTVMIVVDVSRSMMFGCSEQGKYNRVSWIASLLALITMYGSDRVGCILYADEVEQYVPPGLGQSHVHEIMRALPSIGFVTVRDQENGLGGTLDLGARGAATVQDVLTQRITEQDALFKRCGVSCLDNRRGDLFIGELISLFRRRMRY